MNDSSSSAHHAYESTPRDMSLDARLALVEQQIRAQPIEGAHRWALFQLLCVTEQWGRAVQQLQVYAQLQPQQASIAHAYRDLVRAERWRSRVIAGEERPAFVFDAPPWADNLVDALFANAAGRDEDADRAREAALDAAPLVTGHVPSAGAGFEWIGDSDSRFGPVCEMIAAGHYRWLPFSDLAGWRIEPPLSLIDLVWTPCEWTLIDGSVVRGFMPARYPEPARFTQRDDAGLDALRLGRTTTWREAGHTGVIAQGRKTWTTSAGDVGVFELRDVVFGAANASPRSAPDGQS